jgi:hypothetical protein
MAFHLNARAPTGMSHSFAHANDNTGPTRRAPMMAMAGIPVITAIKLAAAEIPGRRRRRWTTLVGVPARLPSTHVILA